MCMKLCCLGTVARKRSSSAVADILAQSCSTQPLKWAAGSVSETARRQAVLVRLTAQMSFSDSVFYYWSDKEWDSCDKFRSAATGVLNPKGFSDMLEWSGSDTTVSPLTCLYASIVHACFACNGDFSLTILPLVDSAAIMCILTGPMQCRLMRTVDVACPGVHQGQPEHFTGPH